MCFELRVSTLVDGLREARHTLPPAIVVLPLSPATQTTPLSLKRHQKPDFVVTVNITTRELASLVYVASVVCPSKFKSSALSHTHVLLLIFN